jgi:hypothetical protein
MGNNVGTVTIKVVPDTSGLRELIRDAIAEALEEVAADLRTDRTRGA